MNYCSQCVFHRKCLFGHTFWKILNNVSFKNHWYFQSLGVTKITRTTVWVKMKFCIVFDYCYTNSKKWPFGMLLKEFWNEGLKSWIFFSFLDLSIFDIVCFSRVVIRNNISEVLNYQLFFQKAENFGGTKCKI